MAVSDLNSPDGGSATRREDDFIKEARHMGRKHEYVGVIDEGAAMFLTPRPGQGPIEATVCAAVKFTGDGRIVRRGTRYRKGDEPRNLMATAARMARPWQSYFERTGKRFELEQDAKRAKKDAKRKAERDALLKLREKAPDLLVSLKALSKAVRFAEVADPDVRAALDSATALIAAVD
jgi:hypothetical protein